MKELSSAIVELLAELSGNRENKSFEACGYPKWGGKKQSSHTHTIISAWPFWVSLAMFSLGLKSTNYAARKFVSKVKN